MEEFNILSEAEMVLQLPITYEEKGKKIGKKIGKDIGIEIGMEIGKAIGIEIGFEQGKVTERKIVTKEIVIAMLNREIDLDIISEVTHLDIEVIKKITNK